MQHTPGDALCAPSVFRAQAKACGSTGPQTVAKDRALPALCLCVDKG